MIYIVQHIIIIIIIIIIVTGTFAGLIPVRSIDGRTIGDTRAKFKKQKVEQHTNNDSNNDSNNNNDSDSDSDRMKLPGTMTLHLQNLYIQSIEEEVSKGRPCNN